MATDRIASRIALKIIIPVSILSTALSCSKFTQLENRCESAVQSKEIRQRVIEQIDEYLVREGVVVRGGFLLQVTAQQPETIVRIRSSKKMLLVLAQAVDEPPDSDAVYEFTCEGVFVRERDDRVGLNQ